MTRFGFVLDQRSCIGCHACTVACKQEHGVELGVFRTWVKYIEQGTFPDTRRYFNSYETHAGRWLGFRQPVQRVAMQRAGRAVQFTYEANPGGVWEEGEFWIEVSWRADPDGSLGIRQYYESPYRPGEKIRLEEYYRWMFENSVPGLPEKAAAEGLDPLGYMRKYGAVEVSRDDYGTHEEQVEDPGDTQVTGVEHTLRTNSFDPGHLPLTGRPDTIAAIVDGVARRAGSTPRRASSSCCNLS